MEPIAIGTSGLALYAGVAGLKFLARICNPAADEMGQLLKDRVARFRNSNAEKLLNKAAEIAESMGLSADSTASPRIVNRIVFEQGSWVDDDHLRDLWAGLLVSSCTPDGRDDSSLVFTRLLEDLTGVQSRIVEFGCTHAVKRMDKRGLVFPAPIFVTERVLKEVAQSDDIQRLDRELDCMRTRGLLVPDGGIELTREMIQITPSCLAIQLWCRCKGASKHPGEFFGLAVETRNPNALQTIDDCVCFHEVGKPLNVRHLK